MVPYIVQSQNMTELWMPNVVRQPDPTNIYDIAHAMQEQLAVLQPEQRIQSARYAVEALSAYLDRLDEQQRSLTLLTDTALYQQADVIRTLCDIGIRGTLDDISYVQIHGEPIGLTLAVDAYQTFSPQDPSSHVPLCAKLYTPIKDVRFIETAA
jgi:hypothetical protein